MKRSRAFSNSEELQRIQNAPTTQATALVQTTVDDSDPWGQFCDFDDTMSDDGREDKKRNTGQNFR